MVIAATRLKKNIDLLGNVVGPGEMRHRSLYPENLKFNCLDSTCFKLRIRPLGFDNVSLIAKTVFRGCMPNNNDVIGRSEYGYESMGDSFMHINMEGIEFKHGLLETPPLSVRSSASSAASKDTKWSAKTKNKERNRIKTQVDLPLGNKLQDISEDEGQETHRIEA